MRDDQTTTGQSFESPESSESVHSPSHQAPPRPQPTQQNNSHFFVELAKIALVAMIVVLPLRMFVAQPFIVSGASMQPTFSTGDYLIVEELSYRFEKPERKDVVVFRYPNDPSKFFIKRVIGLPGETVSIKNGQVTIKNKVHPEGFVLHEPYVTTENKKESDSLTTTLGEDEYFVLGDNRRESSDSRAWGELPARLVVGQAFVQLLPVQNARIFPGTVISE